MKKRFLALILVFIIMMASTVSFAYPNDIPKIFSRNSIKPPIHRMINTSFK